MHTDIIKTWTAHGVMRSGESWSYTGYMPRKILFYIWRHHFFNQETQPDKGSFRIPGSILDRRDHLFTLSFCFQLAFRTCYKKQYKNQKLPVTFSPKKVQLDKGHFRLPRKFLYEIDYLFTLSKFSPVKLEILLEY